MGILEWLEQHPEDDPTAPECSKQLSLEALTDKLKAVLNVGDNWPSKFIITPDRIKRYKAYRMIIPDSLSDELDIFFAEIELAARDSCDGPASSALSPGFSPSFGPSFGPRFGPASSPGFGPDFSPGSSPGLHAGLQGLQGLDASLDASLDTSLDAGLDASLDAGFAPACSARAPTGLFNQCVTRNIGSTSSARVILWSKVVNLICEHSAQFKAWASKHPTPQVRHRIRTMYWTYRSSQAQHTSPLHYETPERRDSRRRRRHV